MGATEFLQTLKDQFRLMYIQNVNGRLLSKELMEEYFELKEKMGRLYGLSSSTHPDFFFKRIIQESHPWLATASHK
jgi:hypothetical protein